jgi:hypothetical protein
LAVVVVGGGGGRRCIFSSLLFVVVCSRRYCLLLFVVVVRYLDKTYRFFYVKYHGNNENPAPTNEGSTNNLCQS